jgi:predicted kinase
MKITLTIGLPASGKSTEAEKKILAEGNTVRVNKDLLRTMLHFDKFSGRNEGFTRDASRTLVKSFIESGVNVIVDDTNLNPSTLQSWKDFAKELNAKIEYLDMRGVSVETCIERDANREKRVGKHVIHKMALQYLDYMKGEKVIVCDIDGTIADCSHRQHFVNGENKDWKSFFAGMKDDTVRAEVIKSVAKLCKEENAKLIFVSARPENYRKDTEWWLDVKIGSPLQKTPYSMLIMRETNDKRPDTEVKADIYDKYLKNLNIIKVFDDRPSVIRMWRKKGLEVEDVGQGVEF